MCHKKIFILFVTLLTITATNAQGFGVQAGFLQSTTRERIGSDSEFTRHPRLNGFKAGVFYEHDFYKGLGLNYGLNYSFLADQTPWSKPDAYGYCNTYKTQSQYIDLPLQLQYKLSIAHELYLVFNVGPTFSYGLANTTTTLTKSTLSGSRESFSDNYDNYFQRFDVLLGANLGIQYKNYQLRGGYDWGMMNIFQTEYDSDLSKELLAHRNEFSVKFIYNFKLKK